MKLSLDEKIAIHLATSEFLDEVLIHVEADKLEEAIDVIRETVTDHLASLEHDLVFAKQGSEE